MSAEVDAVLERVLHAQRRNALLAGAHLRFAAEALTTLASEESKAWLMPIDAGGERILGAAQVISSQPLRILDTSGLGVRTQAREVNAFILVSGAAAGPLGLSGGAALARTFGASRVMAAVLDADGALATDGIAGIDRVILLAADCPDQYRRATSLLATTHAAAS